MVKQVVPLPLMADHSGADVHTAAHGELLKEAPDRTRGPTGGCTLEQSVPEELYAVERTPIGAVLEELQVPKMF